ncbi:MAG: DUF4440 domain-containing protein [Gemmatimonadales bacterium]
MEDRELLRIERELWTGGPDSYRSAVDEDCLVAFGGRASLSTKEEVVGSVPENGQRWRDLEMHVQGMVEPVDGVAILTYRAAATRGDEPRYHALVSSGYVKRDEGWKLMFHQQTPLDE